jgi:antitoxin (DNA-binding transcriptional repressor) of toxin-antitoxin stability system
MAQVNDPESPLNVRSAPSTETGEVVGQLRNGTFVTVADEQNGWFRITTPTKGWISKQQTESGCNQKVERVQFGAGASAATIGDRFIGTGTHQYLFRVSQGQTLTIARRNGPFPTVTNPDGKVLVAGPDDEDRSTWSTETTQAGDYTISLDSNYRGYKYGFRVEVK